MRKQISRNSIYNYIVFVLLLTAVAIAGGAKFEWLKPSEEPVYDLSNIQQPFPKATSFKTNSDNSLSVLDASNHHIGYALISDELDARSQGYVGNIPILIAINNNKKVLGVYLLKNNETADYIEHVVDKHLLESWNGSDVDTTLILTEVDAITGASRSSNAIISNVQKTVSNYLLLEKQQIKISWTFVLQTVMSLLLVLLSLNMVLRRKHKKIYLYYLVAILGIMGLWLKQMLSLEVFHNWLSHGFPWQSNPVLIVILLLSIAMAIAGHKKYYCNFLCPMGALQVLSTKISPFKKRKFPVKIGTLTIRNIYLTYIWVSLLLGFTLPLSNMEPFIAFSFAVASYFMLGAGILIVILSLFFNRPWCQLCPTGCLLDSVPSLFSNAKIKNNEK
ncbi:FMN-binding protein [Carboxylicivirga linearis]|uniref:FMN-binding protein n=1 Tax=Carboxylicivirga linearis TaxID=1628157 RepID=A0ABS5JSS1_9BACT|nr:FMN-binding protein [Carboxylicivirga linearis]MBS2097850.1 FMN-binding protein [Carboxylicivirga linearis]